MYWSDCILQGFSGTQNVSSLQKDEAWRVNVRIQGCDLEHGYLCGTMEALNVPLADTPVRILFVLQSRFNMTTTCVIHQFIPFAIMLYFLVQISFELFIDQLLLATVWTIVSNDVINNIFWWTSNPFLYVLNILLIDTLMVTLWTFFGNRLVSLWFFGNIYWWDSQLVFWMFRS